MAHHFTRSPAASMHACGCGHSPADGLKETRASPPHTWRRGGRAGTPPMGWSFVLQSRGGRSLRLRIAFQRVLTLGELVIERVHQAIRHEGMSHDS